MAKDYTNQHIVPKRYLDRFGTKDGKRTIIGAQIVDKGNVRFFTDSTVNVGYIKNYYDVTDKNDPKYWEHYFAREIDTLCGQDIENIIAKVTLSCPDTIARYNFAQTNYFFWNRISRSNTSILRHIYARCG